VAAFGGQDSRGGHISPVFPCLKTEQATKIDLVINLRAAKALGVAIPETLLATAGEVIQ
jgi:hypothetical protein